MKKLKCPSCGSTDKNTADVFDAQQNIPVMKVVNCNQCGHTTFYFVSALEAADVIMHNPIRTQEEYESVIRYQHGANHENKKTTK